MFSISKAITEYSWPVVVHLPADGGKVEKSTFDATFKRVSATRINEIREAIEAGKITDVGLATEVLNGWSGVSDGDDALPYSEENKAALLDIPTVAAAIVRAFFESLSGAPRKN
jgi:hypothetical protein